MSEAIIKVDNLSKRFRISHEREAYLALRDKLAHPIKAIQQMRKPREDFWALKDISFEINQGEVVGLIGPNGSGKSTLLKVLSRITPPTKGEAVMKGRVASLLEVGTGFHPELTGRENIYLSGVILGMSKAEIKKHFDEIVEFAGIEKFLDTPVKRYSSGMAVRLGFAVAAHLESEILIVDEVLAVGDAEFQKKCIGKMNDLSKDGARTILFVSHNMGAVRSLCEKGVFLRSGEVVAQGNMDEVIEDYENSVFGKMENSNGVFVRKEKGDNMITKVEMFNRENVLSNKFSYKDLIRLKISLDAKKMTEAGYYIVWVIYDERGNLVATDSTTYSSVNIDGQTEVDCLIGPLTLTQQKYQLEIGVGIGGHRIDSWKDDILFEVVECDPRQNGQLFTKNYGSCFIDSQWTK